MISQRLETASNCQQVDNCNASSQLVYSGDVEEAHQHPIYEARPSGGVTAYRISMETDILQAQLSRFVKDPGVSLSLATIDKLC